MSVTVLLLPFSTNPTDGSLTAAGYISGVIFWTGLLGGSISYIVLCRKYKKELSKERQRIPAILRFFSNRTAVIIDVCLVIGLAGIIFSRIVTRSSTVIELISLFLLITSIYLHCLVNGKLFAYIMENERSKEV